MAKGLQQQTLKTDFATPQPRQVARTIELLALQGWLRQPRQPIQPGVWTAHFHYSPDPSQSPEPALIKATHMIHAKDEQCVLGCAYCIAKDALASWYSDNPQPNGARPLTIVALERGDTRKPQGSKP